MWFKINKDAVDDSNIDEEAEKVAFVTKEAAHQMSKSAVPADPQAMAGFARRAQVNPAGMAMKGLGSLMYPHHSTESAIPTNISDDEFSPQLAGVNRSARRFGDYASNFGGLIFGEDAKPEINRKVREATRSILKPIQEWTGWTPESGSRQTTRDILAATNPSQNLNINNLQGTLDDVIKITNENRANYGLSDVAPAMRELAQVDPTVGALFRKDATPAEKYYASKKTKGVLMAARAMGVPPARAVQVLHKKLGNISDYTGEQLATMIQKQRTYDRGLYA